MKTRAIQIPANGSDIHGDLNLVEDAKGLVIFAHGSGSSRKSSRNQYVANLFNNASFATLLFDLLTPEEERVDVHTREFRFNIPLLAERLVTVTQWIEHKYRNTPIHYFGASTGAAAALIAAAQLPRLIKTVISRGGRPDLADEYLQKVEAATLLIVGELDYEVIKLNRLAYEQLTGEKEIKIVPGATHLFEEPGTLDIVARLSIDWLNRHK
jgi:pimeloyl-ACP methyl ester carboxylesterase